MLNTRMLIFDGEYDVVPAAQILRRLRLIVTVDCNVEIFGNCLVPLVAVGVDLSAGRRSELERRERELIAYAWIVHREGCWKNAISADDMRLSDGMQHEHACCHGEERAQKRAFHRGITS